MLKTSARKSVQELYIGVMVNHKTVTNKIRKTKTQVPKDEQYQHENFCEPIIEESVPQVQQAEAQGLQRSLTGYSRDN